MQQKGLDFGPKEEPPRAPEPARRKALTVSELTERIQGVLETDRLFLPRTSCPEEAGTGCGEPLLRAPRPLL